MVGVVAGFGQPVRVEDADARIGREPADQQLPLQRLTGGRDEPQVGQLPRSLLQVRQHHLQVRRDHLDHVDPPVDQRVHESAGVEDDLLRHDQRAGADDEPGDQLPQGDVEALRRGLGDGPARSDAEIVDLGVQVVDQAEVTTDGALRLAGRARGEVDVGRLVGADRDARVGVRTVERADLERLDRRPGQIQVGAAAGLGQRHPAVGPAQHRGHPLGREVRLDRQVDPAGLEHRQHRGQPVQVPLGDHGDGRAGGRPAGQQRVRDPVGPPVELPVRQCVRAEHGGHGVGVLADLLLEQLVRASVGQLPVPVADPAELLGQLLLGQQLGLVVRRVRLGPSVPQRGPVVARDPRGPGRVQPIRPVREPDPVTRQLDRVVDGAGPGPAADHGARLAGGGRTPARDQLAPGSVSDRDPAGRRPGPHADLALPGQHALNRGVHGQQHVLGGPQLSQPVQHTGPERHQVLRRRNRLHSAPFAAVRRRPTAYRAHRPVRPEWAGFGGGDQVHAAVVSFALLADATRVRMLWELREGEQDVSTVAGAAGCRPTVASQHGPSCVSCSLPAAWRPRPEPARRGALPR